MERIPRRFQWSTGFGAEALATHTDRRPADPTRRARSHTLAEALPDRGGKPASAPPTPSARYTLPNGSAGWRAPVASSSEDTPEAAHGLRSTSPSLGPLHALVRVRLGGVG